ncbi:aminotransferase class III-fold pyridoxal phosphate-dependent enzyme [Paucibacter sp. O1-1]|nr:aminotransferase class III-fold pyridoxal phosphate-dependent enzyme [Paucibacter sp. O1-1]MDA3827882.1 aminotransferase class III-fold pyridoxal phosphate-dependent enzyme [Paucibacter sp. O1-1]
MILPPQDTLNAYAKSLKNTVFLPIFDEVITGFGRIGAAFASERWQVTPDIITTAKAINNGAIPMGAVFVSNTIHDTCIDSATEVNLSFSMVTYSGHPVARHPFLTPCLFMKTKKLFERAKSLEAYFELAVHSLKGLPNVIDIRNTGWFAAFSLPQVIKAWVNGVTPYLTIA